MKNRAANTLLHPLSLGAILLLLLNDHLLRRTYPSWVTGKAGDFAWLYFAALAAAWMLSLLFPPGRVKRQERLAAAGFAVAAIVFVSGKALPTVHHWMAAAYQAIFGLPFATRLDPTDLVALAALFPAWIVWKGARGNPVRPRLPKGLVVSIFAFLTIANSVQPDVGISNLDVSSGRILANAAYGCFASSDGGMTWGSINWDECYAHLPCVTPTWQSNDDTCYHQPYTQATTVVDPHDPDHIWHFQPGGLIEVSQDRGKTWRIEYSPVQMTQAQEAYYRRSRSGNPDPRQGPFDAVFDPNSGNVIFAMGHSGVLIRTPDGGWTWASVGQYKPARVAAFNNFTFLIMGELLLSLAAGFLILSVLSLRVAKGRLATIFTVIVGLLWLASLVLLPPALSSGYAAALAQPLLGLVVICSALLAPFAVYRLHSQSPRAMWRAVLVALTAALLFAIPYVLWALDINPTYYPAVVISLILAGVVLLFGIRFCKVTAPDHTVQSSEEVAQ